MRSGYVNSADGKLWDYGERGYGWSSWPGSNGLYAYYLDFGGSNVNPSNSYNRWIGFPLRCLAN